MHGEKRGDVEITDRERDHKGFCAKVDVLP